MSTDIILPTKDEEDDPRAYVMNKLVPAVAQLHRICNEFFVPGSVSERELLDMTYTTPARHFNDLDTRIARNERKQFTYSVDPKLMYMEDGKKLKCLFSGIFYVQPEGVAVFRLVRSRDKMVVDGSEIQINKYEPTEFSRYLDIGNKSGQISPLQETYHIQAKFMHNKCYAICRQFTMTSVYV